MAKAAQGQNNSVKEKNLQNPWVWLTVKTVASYKATQRVFIHLYQAAKKSDASFGARSVAGLKWLGLGLLTAVATPLAGIALGLAYLVTSPVAAMMPWYKSGASSQQSSDKNEANNQGPDQQQNADQNEPQLQPQPAQKQGPVVADKIVGDAMVELLKPNAPYYLICGDIFDKCIRQHIALEAIMDAFYRIEALPQYQPVAGGAVYTQVQVKEQSRRAIMALLTQHASDQLGDRRVTEFTLDKAEYEAMAANQPEKGFFTRGTHSERHLRKFPISRVAHYAGQGPREEYVLYTFNQSQVAKLQEEVRNREKHYLRSTR